MSKCCVLLSVQYLRAAKPICTVSPVLVWSYPLWTFGLAYKGLASWAGGGQGSPGHRCPGWAEAARWTAHCTASDKAGQSWLLLWSHNTAGTRRGWRWMPAIRTRPTMRQPDSCNHNSIIVASLHLCLLGWMIDWVPHPKATCELALNDTAWKTSG